MSDYLFSYGTLQPELAPGEIATAVKRLRRVGTGFVCGVMYDLGEYPGLILGGNATQQIEGSVFRIPGDTSVLDELDAYEEYDPKFPESSLFVRVQHPVEMSDGRTLDCWMYLYNRDTASANVVSSGAFAKKRLAS